MRRIIAVALVVVAVVPPVVAGAQVNASVTGVEVGPTSPAPGESVTVTPTIRNLENSGDPLTIDEVELRSADGLPVYADIDDIGTLAPGADVEVPLTHSFEETGIYDLRVHVDGENANTGEPVDLEYPVSLSVRERHPQVGVQTDDSVADVASNGTVTVANGLDTDISNVEVSIEGDGVTMTEDRSVFASVGEGETVTADYRFRPERAGTHELQTTVTYTLPSGTERTVRQNRTIETETARGDVALETSQSGSGAEQTLTVDIVNQGNADVEDIAVSGHSENATVDRTIVESVPSSSTEQVTLNTTLSAPRADVTVTADYERGSVRQTADATTTLQSAPASIDLTGLDITREGGLLRISGSAGNVGTTTASSVVVRVREGENVEPAAPNRDFFIGEIPGTDFSSFDLTARSTGNVSAIPLEVSYLVDGERTTQTFSVPVDDGVAGEQAQEQDGGGPGAGLLAVAGLALVAILVAAGLLVRRYRRGDDIGEADDDIGEADDEVANAQTRVMREE